MPDGRGGFGSANRSQILKLCEKHWDAFFNDCSGFVKAVSDELLSRGALSGQANDIYEQVQQKPWLPIGTGSHAADIAAIMAAQDGRFVLAVSKDSPNGQVAIITDYRHAWKAGKASNGRPFGYWGSLGATAVEGQRAATRKSVTWTPDSKISLSWSKENLKKVLFVYREL